LPVTLAWAQGFVSPQQRKKSMMHSPHLPMHAAFARLSPRLNPRAAPWLSRIISVTTVLLFAALVAQAFFRQGLASWSVGIVYILYDTFLLAFTAVHIARLRRAPDAASMPDATRPAMAVIIAARNEAAVLGITIDTLAAQDEPPELILLADDGSTDDSPAVLAERYGLMLPAVGEISDASPMLPSLRWLRLPHGGKARALNAALAMVSEPVVLTVDADTLLAPGALRAMRDAFTVEPELVAATGVIAPVCGPDVRGRLFQWFQGYEYVRNFLSRYAWMQLNGLLLVSGAFAAFRRDAVIEVGGFDPDCMVEDYELIHRLHRYSADEGRGWTVRVVGRALAVTDAPASALAFLRQRRRWFGGFLQTQYWNRDMVGNRHFGRLGTAMLPVKALDTMQPIYGVAAFIILIGALVTGTARVALPIIIIMVVKIAIDLSFHLWSLGRYKAWTGQQDGLALGPAILASLAEPFSFQLLLDGS
jgi:cellulose synthase/poly-beta-1,6-N-acetylglucosamine synthase-like glycosyltransferase